ncbi:MAG: hypothetical protein Q9170_005225 [Blastenia crenularia]
MSNQGADASTTTSQPPPLPPPPPANKAQGGEVPPWKCKSCGNKSHKGECWQVCANCSLRHHPERKECPPKGRNKTKPAASTASSSSAPSKKGSGSGAFGPSLMRSQIAYNINLFGSVDPEALRSAFASVHTGAGDRVQSGRVTKQPGRGKRGGKGRGKKAEEKKGEKEEDPATPGVDPEQGREPVSADATMADAATEDHGAPASNQGQLPLTSGALPSNQEQQPSKERRVVWKDSVLKHLGSLVRRNAT